MSGGLQSSTYKVDLVVEAPIIAINAKILTNDIVITKDFLNGDSGQLRILFSFNTVSDYQITITKLGAANLLGSPLKLNADNNFVLKSDGYYRFDISVEPGDLINLSSNIAIDNVNDIQVQKIPIGV